MNQPRITRMQPGFGDSRPCLDPGSIRVPSVAENHPLVELQTSPPNPLLPAPAPDAPGAASAVVARATAPKPVAQPQQARVSFQFTESEAAKCGLLARWQSAIRRREARAAKKHLALTVLTDSVSSLFARAETEGWSQRRLAARLAIPETTLRRIRDRQVNPLTWLPKLQAAQRRLPPHNNRNDAEDS